MMKWIYLILTLALVTSCNNELEESPSVLVVEGWIDYGENPIVKLTWSVPISEKIYTNDLSNYIEQWAKVTVSDGEKEVILMRLHTSKYVPPYIYTTTKMEGELGKTYTLKVECPNGTRAEAETTILPPTEITSFQSVPVATVDTLRRLYAFIDMSDNTPKYYKSYTRTEGNKLDYLSSYRGLVSSDILAADGKITLYNGKSNLQKEFTPYFCVGDTVAIKFSRLTQEGYNFWRAYENINDLSDNPLFPSKKNLPSNIKGGMGYWMGLGSSFYYLKIEKDKATLL